MLQRTPHVLVVDDSPGVCELVEATLGSVGMRVSVATDAGAARAILAAGPVDLALVDLVLASESGLGIAKHALTLGARVLLMSGFADAGDADDLPFSFIAKPFPIRELVDVATFLVSEPALETIAR